MATLRRSPRSGAISSFRPMVQSGGEMLRALADTAQTGYEMLRPRIMRDAEERGMEDGLRAAQQYLGDPSQMPAVPAAVSTSGQGAAPSQGGGNFPASLIETESGGNWNALNNEQGAGGRGHGGRLQFGTARLQDAANAGIIGPMSPQEFAQQPPEVQTAVENWHFADIDQQSQRLGLDRYIGQTVAGIPITQDGIRAMAHLGGIGGAQRFLESGGRVNPSDSFGTSLADYARRHGGPITGGSGQDQVRGGLSIEPVQQDRLAPTPAGAAGGPIPPNAVPTVTEVVQPPPMGGFGPAPSPVPQPVQVRTASGRLELRPISPFAHEVELVYQAAAEATALTEVLNRGVNVLADIQRQFPTDLAGFRSAAQGQIDGLLEGLGSNSMRMAARADLMQEVERSARGVAEAQHEDIRRRQVNANDALIQRHSDTYAALLAGGDQDGAAAALAELEGALYLRESLPGIAWTREQSENTVINARNVAERQRAAARDQQVGTWRDSLNTIIDARQAGMVGADEAILQNPEVWAADPELAQEAAAWVEFASVMPGFNALPPSEQAAAAEQMRNQPVTDDYQIKMAELAGTAARNSATAWATDPVEQARAALANTVMGPPPELPTFDPANPQGYAAGLRARAAYMDGLAAAGYIETPRYLSADEATAMSLTMAAELPADLRLGVATSLVAGFGEAAVGVFDQLEIDPVLRHGAQLMALGGDPAVAAMALRGEQLVAEGLVTVPAAMGRLESVSPNFMAALEGTPMADVQAMGQVMGFAKSIYAANAVGVDPESPEAAELMESAVQQAMGGATDARGRETGGVRDINGFPTWLPVGVAADDVRDAWSALTGALSSGGDSADLYGYPGLPGMAPANPAQLPVLDMWLNVQPDGVAASLPYAGNAVIPGRYLNSGMIRFIPTGRETYRMEISHLGQVVDIATESGMVFELDMGRMIEAAQ
jgi:hypothetical protein